MAGPVVFFPVHVFQGWIRQIQQASVVSRRIGSHRVPFIHHGRLKLHMLICSWFPRLLLGLLLGLLVTQGCGSWKSNQPVTPSVEFSKGRKIYKVDISKLRFPENFPKEISLLAPEKVYEQDLPSDLVTWDTRATPKEAVDHYVAEFQKLGLETFVSQPPNMPGENYQVHAFSEKHGKCFCVGIGKQRPESQVGCFVFAREATKENWKTGG